MKHLIIYGCFKNDRQASKEFKTSAPDHMIDKTTLAEAVWGDHIDQADNFDFVYAQMKNLRRRLHDAQADIEIRAVYGFGYKLVTP